MDYADDIQNVVKIIELEYRGIENIVNKMDNFLIFSHNAFKILYFYFGSVTASPNNLE